MKINVELNEKSIKKAIDELKSVQKLIQTTIMPEYLKLVCQWIINRAKWYVDVSDIGDNVKTDINSHWYYQLVGNSAKIINDSDKAVFVEFGVGYMGSKIPHENASSAEYKYNVNNHFVFGFDIESLEDVDMHEGYRFTRNKDGTYHITTIGSWRVMFAYQAIVDARDDLMNPSGELAKTWQKVLKEYIK